MSIDYKYKPDKHKFRVNIKTIDELHKEQVDEFKKNRDTVPDKKNRLKLLKNDLTTLEKSVIGPINLDYESFKRRKIMKQNIKDLEQEIKNAENYKAEIHYYSRTGDVVYDYYDLTNGVLYNKTYDNNKEDEGSYDDIECKEEKNNKTTKDMKEDKNVKEVKSKIIASTTKIAISDELMEITNLNRKRKLKRPVRKRNKKIDVVPERNIMSYLLGDKDEEEENEEEKEDSTLCKATLQNEYLIMMDKEYACSKSKVNIPKKCQKCNIDKIIVYNDSIIACPKCGEYDNIFIESDVPSHRETFNEKPKYPYRRIGHCIEKLNQFLCKGTTNIPSEVFSILENEVVKHGMVKKEITVNFIETMLRKHRLSTYYEYIMFIYSKMTNTPPQTITREEYELVLKMFAEADVAYEKRFKPKTRHNFLKYTFVLNKIFLTIGKKSIADHFKLLKSPTKMKEQERIWQYMCTHLGWTYHSS
jgi:hypothetical protein